MLIQIFNSFENHFKEGKIIKENEINSKKVNKPWLLALLAKIDSISQSSNLNSPDWTKELLNFYKINDKQYTTLRPLKPQKSKKVYEREESYPNKTQSFFLS